MILLVQFREDISKPHEEQCVRKHLSDGEELRAVSVFDADVDFAHPAELLAGVDKLILGGSGALSLGENHDDQDPKTIEHVIRTMTPLMNYVLKHDFPTLGACLGHHLIGHFLGSQVVFDEAMAETGILKIDLTPEGKLDPLFDGIPAQFDAVVGHQDSVTTVPPGVVRLASTPVCPTHAFRYKNNIYSTQFHSELDFDDLIYRLRLFPQYVQYAKTLEPVEMPYAIRVLKNFLAMPDGARIKEQPLSPELDAVL